MSVQVDNLLKEEMIHETDMNAIFDDDDALVEHMISLEDSKKENQQPSIFDDPI